MEYNRRYNDNDPCWLVKVDTLILGPYSFNEVLVKLTAGELLPSHEVISPLDRWRSIQSQPLFSAAVEKIKQENEEPGEYTLTKTEAERTSFTRTLELTIDRMTQTPTPTQTPPPEDGPFAGVGISAPVNPQAPSYQASPVTPKPQQTYFPPVVSKPKKSVSPFTIMFGALFVGLAIIAGYMMTQEKDSAEPQEADKFLTYVDRGLILKREGKWYEALSEFKKAYQLNHQDADLIFEMAPLLIQLENQSLATRGYLEKVMKTQYKKEYLALGNNLLGLTYAYEDQKARALEFYNKALKQQNDYLPALINKGFTLALADKFTQAKNQFSQTTQFNQQSAIAYLYLIETYILEGTKTGNSTAFENAYKLAGQAARRFYDGQQEALMFQAYAALKLGKERNHVANLIEKALSVDPEQTNEHLHSPLIDWRGLKWGYFAFVCDSLASVVKQDTLAMLKFVCTYRSYSEIKAQKEVESWMRRSPKSPEPHIAHAIFWYRMRDYKKAQLSLNLAQSLGASGQLYLQILIKVCGQLNDEACLKKAAGEVAAASPLHHYLALAMIGENDQAIAQGLRESKNYLPILNLRQ